MVDVAIALVLWGLVCTFLVSRFLLGLCRSWHAQGFGRLVLCHAASLLLTCLLFPAPISGGSFIGGEQIRFFLPMQVGWLVFDSLWPRMRGDAAT